MNATKTAPTDHQATCESPETYVRKPLYSVSGNADTYDVRILMPGVSKTGVRVDFEDSVLTVHGKSGSSTPDGWKVLHSELPTADFKLRLRLNALVDEEKMAATMENGVLTLRLPVREAAKPRRVEVQ